MFKRKIYDKLLAWKQESEGRTTLLIEGPRRVGKSTVVTEFAKKYESYILIDFSTASKGIRNLFMNLVRDHCYSYIETGSLISLKRNVKDILIPNEERKLMRDFRLYMPVGRMPQTVQQNILERFSCHTRPGLDSYNSAAFFLESGR